MAEKIVKEGLVPQTPRVKRAQVHKDNAKERADKISDVKMAYQSIKDNPAILDLLSKIEEFTAWHSKVGRDGVGYRDALDAEGNKIQQVVTLSNEERVKELDQAAGCEQIGDYLKRQLATPTS